jgi:hypothetical protein
MKHNIRIILSRVLIHTIPHVFRALDYDRSLHCKLIKTLALSILWQNMLKTHWVDGPDA